jgi:hypothetical protein
MTKVQMNLGLLAYRQYMQESLRQVLQQNFIGGISRADQPEEILLVETNLLPPPRFMTISLDGYAGQGGDFIGVVIFHDFGVHAVHISIRDGQGNLIENGAVSSYPDNPICWEYLPTALVPVQR